MISLAMPNTSTLQSCFVLLGVCLITILPARCQQMTIKADAFLHLLDSAQLGKAFYPFDTTERYRFNYIPLDDRKGISLNELNAAQKKGLEELLATCISQQTLDKIHAIQQLDNVLKVMEGRKPDDHFRDPGKYFITIFGIPGSNTIWGWRFEGHHVAFHFSAEKNELISGTPSFLGSNPAIVLSGPEKNKEVLKEETEKGFAMLHTLNATEFKDAIIDSIAPGDIVTKANRQALIEHPVGVNYNQLTPAHQQQLLQLIALYLHRYTKPFAAIMLKEIQAAGLDKLWFSWAGYTDHLEGKPCYYRIQGPTIIIEYDNSQNNANHIHTVIRDLKNDFGGDILLQHYRSAGHAGL